MPPALPDLSLSAEAVSDRITSHSKPFSGTLEILAHTLNTGSFSAIVRMSSSKLTLGTARGKETRYTIDT